VLGGVVLGMFTSLLGFSYWYLKKSQRFRAETGRDAVSILEVIHYKRRK